MKFKILNWIIFSLLISAGAFSLNLWLGNDPVTDFFQFVPGMDGRPVSKSISEIIVKIGQYSQTFDGVPASITGSWPRFRGINEDNIGSDEISLQTGGGRRDRKFSGRSTSERAMLHRQCSRAAYISLTTMKSARPMLSAASL